MFFNIVQHILVQRQTSAFGFGMRLVVEHAADLEQQVLDTQCGLCPAPKLVCVQFFEQAQEQGLERVKGIAVVVENVVVVRRHILWQKPVIWGQGQDLSEIGVAQPQHKAPVREFSAVQNGAVCNFRGNKDHIAKGQRIARMVNLNMHHTFEEKIKFVKVVCVQCDLRQITVAVVIDFIIFCQHVLSGLEGSLQIFFHW